MYVYKQDFQGTHSAIAGELVKDLPEKTIMDYLKRGIVCELKDSPLNPKIDEGNPTLARNVKAFFKAPENKV